MLDGLFSLTPNMIAWHGIFEMLDELTPVLIYKGDSSNQPAMRTARSVYVLAWWCVASHFVENLPA
ncbi:hypothetical protein T01_6342 [Trichinella spiralis]|uniref:Uncharacterized protein n=1 Tax=Trichinella spiralis TaxID=6334 RepID=A0A0V1ATT6_TRISP|nr:hypothetical protein T01_6342 [Trichinella spiralis]